MFLLAISVLLLLVYKSFTYDLPDYFPKCELVDSDLNNCIGRAANALRPHIRKGIKEIKFPSLEPLVVPRINVNQDSNLVNYTAELWNYTIQGLDNYDLTEITYDPGSMTFNGKMGVDSLDMATVYTLNGRLLTIPIEGKGNARLAIGPFNGTFEVKCKIVKRKGIEYYKPTSTKIRMVIGDGSYYFAGLFDGNELMGRLTNDMVNQNSKAITDAVTPMFEVLAEKGLMFLMESLMQLVSYQILFPSSHK